MTPHARLVLPALALLMAGAAPYIARLDARRCRALPLQQVSGLAPDWVELARYVRRCPIRGPEGDMALNVDIVRLDQAYAAGFFRGHPDQVVPRPVLRDAEGVVVGELPAGFPVDPPSMLRVRFTEWRRGFPHEILLYEAGESALAPHPLPSLHWDTAARRYK